MNKINKGTMVIVEHQRKGIFKGVFYDDYQPYPPDNDEFYPIEVTDRMNAQVNDGDQPACRASFCKLTFI